MGAKKRFFRKLSIAAVALALVAISSILITGQPASKHHVGLVEDWSTRHVVFSNPGTYEQAYAKGAYPKWLRTQYDTRFLLQQMKRNAAAVARFSPVTATR